MYLTPTAPSRRPNTIGRTRALFFQSSVLNMIGSSALHESKTMSFDKTLDAGEVFDMLPVACLVGEKS